MQTTWRELIDRARTYTDDDHDDEKAWITPERWLTFGKTEFGYLWRRWAKLNPAGVLYTDEQFTGSPHTIGAATYAIVGVAQVYNSSTPYRLLRPAQSSLGVSPYWNQIEGGPACTWSLAGVEPTGMTITIDPADTGGTYLVRYVASLAPLDAALTLDTEFTIMDGWDERLVLGMARRAHVKDSVRSSAIAELIVLADADIGFSALGQIIGESPKVKIKRGMTSRPRFYWPGLDAWRYV